MYGARENLEFQQRGTRERGTQMFSNRKTKISLVKNTTDILN